MYYPFSIIKRNNHARVQPVPVLDSCVSSFLNPALFLTLQTPNDESQAKTSKPQRTHTHSPHAPQPTPRSGITQT